MTWFRLDDQGAFHEKVLKAKNEAYGAWCRAGQWSSLKLTEGRIPRDVALTIAPLRVWRRLEEAGLCDPTGTEDFQIHDFLDWNPSAAEVVAKRAARSAAGKSGGHRKASNAAKTQESRVAIANQDAKQNSTQSHWQNPAPDPGSRIPSSAPTERAPDVPSSPPPLEVQQQLALSVQEPAGSKPKRTRKSVNESARAIGWRTFRAAYTAKYKHKYSHTSTDGPAMERIVKAALDFLIEMGRATSDLEALLTHRWAAYLRDPGDKNWLIDNAHPLQNFERGVPRYGSPWDKPAAVSRPIARSPPEQRPEPVKCAPELVASLKAAGNGGSGQVVARPSVAEDVGT